MNTIKTAVVLLCLGSLSLTGCEQSVKKPLSVEAEACRMRIAAFRSNVGLDDAKLFRESNEISEQMPPKEQITADYIAKCKDQVEQINAILDIVGQPNRHALFGLEPVDNRQETLDAIRNLLQEFKGQHEKFTNLLGKMNTVSAGVRFTSRRMSSVEGFMV